VGIALAVLVIAYFHWLVFTEEEGGQGLLVWPIIVLPCLYAIWKLWTAPGPGQLWMPRVPPWIPRVPPRAWRLAYCVPWVALALLLIVATVESSSRWVGEVTVGSILTTTAVVFFPALLPALGFVFIRRRGWLVLVAVAGVVIAVALWLATAAMQPSQSILSLVSIAVVATVAVSVVAIVVLFVVSHETRPPSAGGSGGWGDGDFPSIDFGN
jgi:hypothetical protein